MRNLIERFVNVMGYTKALIALGVRYLEIKVIGFDVDDFDDNDVNFYVNDALKAFHYGDKLGLDLSEAKLIFSKQMCNYGRRVRS